MKKTRFFHIHKHAFQDTVPQISVSAIYFYMVQYLKLYEKGYWKLYVPLHIQYKCGEWEELDSSLSHFNRLLSQETILGWNTHIQYLPAASIKSWLLLLSCSHRLTDRVKQNSSVWQYSWTGITQFPVLQLGPQKVAIKKYPEVQKLCQEQCNVDSWTLIENSPFYPFFSFRLKKESQVNEEVEDDRG